MNYNKLFLGLIFLITLTVVLQVYYSGFNFTFTSEKSSVFNDSTFLQITNWTIILPPKQLAYTNVSKRKRILFWGTFYGGSDLQDVCIENNSMDFCPFKCEYTFDQQLLAESDAIVIHGRESKDMRFPLFRSSHQRYVFLMFESPAHSWFKLSGWNNIFNWTMSYRNDSDIHVPYGEFKPIEKSESPNRNQLKPNNSSRVNQKYPIAWAASNCGIVTSGRGQFVEEISKYIPVDIFGQCGKYECVRDHISTSDQCTNPRKCHEYLGSRYKFYLALENSICNSYITEKFFNSFKYDMVPVVFGLPKTAYLRVAPADSFIHADDFASIRKLAEYLNFLDNNPAEYSKYFRWRNHFALEKAYYFTKGWCTLCEKLYTVQDNNRRVYPSIDDWWFYKSDPIVQGKPCKPKAT